MNENFHCGDHEALVAYLYDEGDAGHRETVAAHLARCVSCTEEIESLQSTRAMLAAWRPPDAQLGFRITRGDERTDSRLLRPAAWWRQPLPAWAQVAAAALIFASGLVLGRVQERDTAPAPVATSANGAVPVSSRPVTPTSVAAVSADDLAGLERRLRAVETMRLTSPPAARPGSPVDEDALLERLQALITASEDRQRRENITLLSTVVRDFDLQRRVDLRQMEERLGRIHDTTRVELGRQNDALSHIMRTSLTGAAGR